LVYRSGSSFNVPQDAQSALRDLERATRALDDPSRRRLPAQNASASTSYSHLPAELRAQLEALPPLHNPIHRPRRVNQRVIQRLSAPQTLTQLQAQVAVLPPLPIPMPSPPVLQTVAELQIQAAALPPLLNPVPAPPVPQTPAQLYAQLAALQVNYLLYICKFNLKLIIYHNRSTHPCLLHVNPLILNLFKSPFWVP
jgi:hypothetical protein